MPIDINELREYKGGDVAKWRKFMEMRFKPTEWVDEVVSKDEEWRALQKRVDEMRRDANKLQKDVITPKRKAKEDCTAEIKQLKEMQMEIKKLEAEVPNVAIARDSLLNRIGNLVDPEVPISQDEDADNLVISLYPKPIEMTNDSNSPDTPNAEECKNKIQTLSIDDTTGAGSTTSTPCTSTLTLPCPLKDIKYTFPPILPKTHDDLLYRIGGYEPIRGQNVAGHRGYFLRNAGVLLNQAFINYGIAFLRKKGYDILQPPYMMNKDVMATLAQLEDFDEQLYKVSGKSTIGAVAEETKPSGKKNAKNDTPTPSSSNSEKYLIATSEQPICAFHKGEWLEEKSLPLRYAGVSTCFRKEAGSSGKDIRGIFRVHQFEKIEQFCITNDDFEISQAEQKRMLSIAEEFYQSLGFPYRVVCIVSGELNDAAVKKYDLEAWFPGQQTYRELVSCSNCTDYQARGVQTRCGIKKQSGKQAGDALSDRASYVHMLNSTLCATGRGICCLLENYQTPDGVRVPEVLQPFMAGIDFLPFERDSMELTKGEKKGKAGGGGGKNGKQKK
mmetsp:Transcript_17691/g.24959  ORF Transcript_17691/g.24959 Transcript_17691/m.24959 type:complete len:557 (+) Transcript_17691:127-1797(+)|eukprot:CAMPEP_0184864842 /NCGR_PEP_ID=MMETSP0580-20130426/16119_1 /TAXON_ID=1118495 /ORGANISM="Dactyliosolen fragilissimus" /LENGTH=556 /DNA_ID=CAMNT_0027363763 /DNA_START=102 /DNA_END=1772 /DNA_ORIENTATION=-